MASRSIDILVIGGGIHGAAVARDAAGRGLKVMLAEKGDYACATSSASSKLIHGGLRYLEHLELGLVRESLVERAGLLKTAPHLVAPQRFLLPIYGWQKRQALMLRAGLAIYDALSFGDGLPASGRLDDDDISQLPRLRQQGLTSVLHYCDGTTDDARLTLAVLLDARSRGADIRNRRAVTAIAPLADGYAVELDERGLKLSVEARFIVNASGPWVASVDAMTAASPPPRPLQARARQPYRASDAGPAAERRLHAARRGRAGDVRHSLARRPVSDRRHHRHAARWRPRSCGLLRRGGGLSARGL